VLSFSIKLVLVKSQLPVSYNFVKIPVVCFVVGEIVSRDVLEDPEYESYDDNNKGMDESDEE